MKGELPVFMVMVIQLTIAGPLHQRFLEAEVGFGVIHQVVEHPGHSQLGVRLVGQAIQLIDVIHNAFVLLVDDQNAQFVGRAP